MTTLFDYHSISAQASARPIRLSPDLTVVALWSAVGLAVSAIAYMSLNAAEAAAVLGLL